MRQDLERSSKRPNILLILADDLGQGDVSCFNPHAGWETRHMDQLATEGMRFFDSHATSALCTPSRYGVLTGRYNWRSRLKSFVLLGDAESLIEKDRLTLAQFLSDKGYSTAVVGKWHLGLDWQLLEDGHDLQRFGLSPAHHQIPSTRYGRAGNFSPASRWQVEGTDIDYSKPVTFGPNELGFDYSFITAASNDQPPFVYIENGQALDIPTHFGGDQWNLDRGSDAQSTQIQRGPMVDGYDVTKLAGDFHAKALDVLDAMLKGEDPWFLYVPSHLVHGPILPDDPWKGRSGLGAYGDFVLQLDDYVGELVGAVDEAGQAQNTIVIVTSDNGASPVAGFEDLRQRGHDPSNGWRGEKSEIWEGGHREPFILRWPEVVEPSTTSDHLISHSDIFATLAEVLGEDLPHDAAVDSISQLTAWRGDKQPARSDVVVSSGGGGLAIRRGDWKLQFVTNGDGAKAMAAVAAGAELTQYKPAQLFNLRNDPAERFNLIHEEAEIVAELMELISDYIRRGRSTPGPSQPNEAGTPADRWIQIEWMDNAKEVIALTRQKIHERKRQPLENSSAEC